MTTAQTTEIMIMKSKNNDDEMTKTKTRTETKTKMMKWIKEKWLIEIKNLFK